MAKKKLFSMAGQRGVTLIEFAIAIFVVGVISLALFNLLKFGQKSFKSGEDDVNLQVSTQRAVDEMSRIFSNAGYGLPHAARAVLDAHSDEVTFLISSDTLRFYLSPADSLPDTPNPNDKILYKSENNDLPGNRFLIGARDIAFDYFDSSGTSLLGESGNVDTLYLGRIRLVEISLTMESPTPDARRSEVNRYRQMTSTSSVYLPNLKLLASEGGGEDTISPTVTVTSPNGGESMDADSVWTITWDASDNVSVTSVDCYYSNDGGATFPNTIASGLSNTGSYDWTVPSDPTTQAQVKVVAWDLAENSGEDASDSDFTIVAVTDTIPPSVTLISPNGGESWQVSTINQITWQASDDVGVSYVNLYYSTDSGVTYADTVAAGLANTGLYSWTIPDDQSTTCKVKAAAFDDAANSGADESDADFTIAALADTIPPPPPYYVYAAPGNSKIILAWSASYDPSGIREYYVYIGTDPGSLSRTAEETTITTTSFTVLGLTNGITYYFAVKAVDNYGNVSDFSDIVSETPLGATIFYFHDNQLINLAQPTSGSPDVATATVNKSDKDRRLEIFLTEEGEPGYHYIQPGIWSFYFYGYVNNTDRNTYLYCKVYKFDGEDETLLFTTGYSSALSTSSQVYQITYSASSFYLDSEDRIIVDVWANRQSGGDSTQHVYFEYDATSKVSRFITP